MPEELKPGTPAESWCTKCREMKPHVTVSLKDDGKPARVRCDVCSGEHNYRPSPPQSRRKSSRKSTAGRKKTGPALTDAQKAGARPYQLEGTFREGDVIHHPTFGFGEVTEIRSPQRMMVEFDTSQKQLVFNMSPAGDESSASSSSS